MSSIVSETATIGTDTALGHFCVIGENVSVGTGCRIGHHVIIHADTVIGDNCVVDDHAVLGKLPLSSASMAVLPASDLPQLEIGSRVVVGTGSILFRGSRVGNDCMVADLASVRENVTIGEATIIGRSVSVENRVQIGDRCKIETGSFICAHTAISDDCFVAPEVTLTNDNFMGRTEERKQHYAGTTIERGGRIGANATILPGRTIKADGVAAAGSVVTSDIPPAEIHAGVPSRSLKPVPQPQRLD